MTQTASILVVDGSETATAPNFMRDSFGFDSPTRVHILTINESGGVSRLQVDLLERFK